MNIDALRVEVRPGDGLVARFRDVVLAVMPGGVATRVAGEIVEICRSVSGAETPGRLLGRRLVGVLFESDPADAPAFCALARTEDGISLFLHGDVDAVILRHGEQQRLSGRDVTTWVDQIIRTPFDALWTGSEAPDLGTDARFDLVEGVVPGGGVVLATRERALAGETPPKGDTTAMVASGDASASSAPRTPQSSVAPEAVPAVGASASAVAAPAVPPVEPVEPGAPAAVGPVQTQAGARLRFETVSLLGARAEPRQPLPIVGAQAANASRRDGAAPAGDEPPIVDGILCKRDHFNSPEALYCSVCGISMVQETHNIVRRPRPPLGVIVLDDGTTYSLDADYVIGRQPGGEERVASGRARPLVLQDQEQSVSRVHAEIRLDEWDVLVSDRGSANGTFVYPPDATEWIRLGADTPVRLRPGTHVSIGRRTFVYDSHQSYQLA